MIMVIKQLLDFIISVMDINNSMQLQYGFVNLGTVNTVTGGSKTIVLPVACKYIISLACFYGQTSSWSGLILKTSKRATTQFTIDYWNVSTTQTGSMPGINWITIGF